MADPWSEQETYHEYRRYLSDHPGTPLGHGYTSGTGFRLDSVLNPVTGAWRGESHLMAWQRILRNDPCSYCGKPIGGTLDHIVPQNPLVPNPAIGGKFTWLNLTGACESCNGRKSSQNLLGFLRHQTRRNAKLVAPTREIPNDFADLGRACRIRARRDRRRERKEAARSARTDRSTSEGELPSACSS